VLLQKGLILAFEVLFQHDATHVGALVSKLFLDAQVCAIQRCVVCKLARPKDVRVKRLLALFVALKAVAVEEMLPPVRQRYSSLSPVDVDPPIGDRSYRTCLPPYRRRRSIAMWVDAPAVAAGENSGRRTPD